MKRRKARAKLYDGTEVECTVYSQNDDFFTKPERANDKPPKERYIDLMIEGARHYGVAEEYLMHLKTITVQPRKTREEFDLYPVPEGTPTWNFEQLQQGKQGNPYLFAINGKVVQAADDM